jgi:hypothetical protein
MDASAVFVDENKVCGLLETFEDKVEISHEFGFRDEFDPLDEDMDVPPLEYNVVPLRLSNKVKDETHIQLLIL